MSALGNPAFERRSPLVGETGFTRRAGDFYPTEPWVTQALLDAVDFRARLRGDRPVIWEPACGDGRMALVLEQRLGAPVLATDLHDYGFGSGGTDFLACEPLDADVIVTNPPFSLARDFIVRAIDLTRERQGVVAMLHRHEFDAPQKYRALFLPPNPYAAKLILPRRPRWADDGADGRGKRKGGRFAYAWYLWDGQWKPPHPTVRFLAEPMAAARARRPSASPAGPGGLLKHCPGSA